MARSLVSDCYRKTVESRPIPSPATMPNEEQAAFNRYMNTHSLSAHLLHCAWPLQCPSCDTGQLKKAREHVRTPHAAVLRDEGQSNLQSQLPELEDTLSRPLCSYNMYNSQYSLDRWMDRQIE